VGIRCNHILGKKGGASRGALGWSCLYTPEIAVTARGGKVAMSAARGAILPLRGTALQVECRVAFVHPPMANSAKPPRRSHIMF